ncbi:NADPH-dependent FMN reductase [Glaciihabitans sp. dw_435]|uniref:NADPH-dependent FMN reductase n=1 Tax=Glaciihabitans sp. dw_435 TaxID=2720081 RepID=UPI001BD63942|nr:NAD(P)H-dependent oxidoreductase [Glaciihabitans sp. dw_435]
MTKIAIIIGSTRPGRNGEAVAKWVQEIASRRSDAEFELVDLLDYPLPHFDEPGSPARDAYQMDHTKAWSAKIAEFDGYVFVTPEYNHSTSGVLKNALDYLYNEWNNKAAAFVSYGGVGGARAVEHLRLVASELQMATVRGQVAISLMTEFENYTTFAPHDYLLPLVDTMLDQLVSWAKVMEPLHASEEVADDEPDEDAA